VFGKAAGAEVQEEAEKAQVEPTPDAAAQAEKDAQDDAEAQQHKSERIDIIGDQLQAKIRSKFQTSTFLAGFAFTLLGLEIGRLWQREYIPFLIFVSIPLMVGAAVLYIYAVMKLDALTMPKAFWGEKRELDTHAFSERSYSTPEELWHLKDEMVFYWQKLTIFATFLVGVSLLTMLFPFTSNFSPYLLLWTLAGSVILALLALLYCVWIWKSRPKGPQD